MKKLVRISTVPISLNILLKGQLKFLSQYYDLTAVSGPGADLDEVAEREGVKVHPIEMQRQISPVKDLKALVQLYFLFKKEKPDIVHSITPKAGLLSMMAAKMAGVPVRMHTFTGLIFPSKTGKLQRLLIQMDRLLCSSATHVFPEGNGVKEDLIRFNITKKPLKVLANGNVNGIDSKFFSPSAVSSEQKSRLRTELGIGDSDFVCIFIGRLVRDKGINELIEAFKNVTSENQSGKRVRLILVGPSEQELDPLLPETLAEIERHPDIMTTGFQSDIRPYLAVSHLLVFPSYREGFPNVVIQGGAMGVPAVVTNISGSNEIIRQGENGIIVPAKNAQRLEQAVLQLMHHPDQYRAMASNAREAVVSRFSQEKVWNALLEEYRNALAQG